MANKIETLKEALSRNNYGYKVLNEMTLGVLWVRIRVVGLEYNVISYTNTQKPQTMVFKKVSSVIDYLDNNL